MRFLDHGGAAARQELHVIGQILAASKLIVSAAVRGEPADEELSTPRPGRTGPS